VSINRTKLGIPVNGVLSASQRIALKNVCDPSAKRLNRGKLKVQAPDRLIKDTIATHLNHDTPASQGDRDFFNFNAYQTLASIRMAIPPQLQITHWQLDIENMDAQQASLSSFGYIAVKNSCRRCSEPMEPALSPDVLPSRTKRSIQAGMMIGLVMQERESMMMIACLFIPWYIYIPTCCTVP
jgi:hypothetical protein